MLPKSFKVLIFFLVLLVFSGFAMLMARNFLFVMDQSQVNSFESCVAAGNEQTTAYPPQCRTTDGRVFTKNVPPKYELDKRDKPKVDNFDECAAAGFPIMESSPRQCKTTDGRTFTEKNNSRQDSPITPPSDNQPVCQDKCGDGTCQEIVCMGTNCPCAETKNSCPQDCPSQPDQSPTSKTNSKQPQPSNGLPEGWQPI